MSNESKKLLLYSVLTALVVWFAITRFYLHWSPLGRVGSLGLALVAGAIGFAISKPIAKRIGILSQPTLHVILVAITTGTTLLTVAYYSAPTMEMTINCIDHTVEGNELNRFEKVQIVYVASQPMEVKIKFGLLSPLWLHKIRQKKINGMAPGTSPNVYKVNGSDDHYHFTFICGTEPPSSGMVQIPRQY